MNEMEWSNNAQPIDKLTSIRPTANDRKLLLYAIVCCRSIWHLYEDERCRRAVQVAQAFVEDDLPRSELVAASDAVREAFRIADEDLRHIAKRIDGRFSRDSYGPWRRARLRHVLAQTAMHFDGDAFHAAHWASTYARKAAGDVSWASVFPMTPEREPEGCAQDCYLRDIFGNPYRPAKVQVHWRTRDVVALAQAIYDGWDFDRMPELARDLEAVGCGNVTILNHCRGPGPHVRGCWVVDMCLSKT